MQAAFDSAYFGNRNDLEQKALRRGQQLTALQGKIVGVKPSEASAFDGRTSLYRQIFQYLLVHANVKVCASAAAAFLCISASPPRPCTPLFHALFHTRSAYIHGGGYVSGYSLSPPPSTARQCKVQSCSLTVWHCYCCCWGDCRTRPGPCRRKWRRR